MLTVGRLVEKKGIDISIRAAAEVLQRTKCVEYDIVGDGDLRASLQRLIDELGVGDCVRLTGWKTQAELRKIFDRSHLFCTRQRDGRRWRS